MLKAISIILLLGLLVGMVIRAVLPRPTGHLATRGPARPRTVETATKCPSCGAYRLGDGQCPTPGCRSGRR